MPERRASTKCVAGPGFAGRFAFLVFLTFVRFAPAVLDEVEREDLELRVLRVLRVWAISDYLNCYGSFDVRMRLIVANFEIIERVFENRWRTTLDVKLR